MAPFTLTGWGIRLLCVSFVADGIVLLWNPARRIDAALSLMLALSLFGINAGFGRLVRGLTKRWEYWTAFVVAAIVDLYLSWQLISESWVFWIVFAGLVASFVFWLRKIGRTSLDLLLQVQSHTRSWRGGSYAYFVFRYGDLSPIAVLSLLLATLFRLLTLFALLVAFNTLTRDPNLRILEYEGFAIGACYLFARSLHSSAMTYMNAAENFMNQRAPKDFVLHLRSFLDDGVEFGHYFAPASIQEVIRGALWRCAPLLCVRGRRTVPARPSEALELSVLSADWLAEIADLAKRARWVVLTIGFTGGLALEYDRLVQEGQQCRMLMLLPENDRHERWEAMFGQGHFSPAARSFIEDALVARFLEDGSLILMLGGHSVRAYEFALRAATLPSSILGKLPTCNDE